MRAPDRRLTLALFAAKLSHVLLYRGYPELPHRSPTKAERDAGTVLAGVYTEGAEGSLH